MPIYKGVFMGATLLQAHQKVGGARSVFVKLDAGNEQVLLPIGGRLMNPFRGQARIFAGDLFEYRTDEHGESPEVYLLKTYLVKSQSGSKVVIYKDGYKHVPFVGDVLMKAPTTIGGTGKAYSVTAVSTTSEGNWELTFSSAIDSVSDGDVLVEGESASSAAKMLIKRVNSVASVDYDCFYPSSVEDSFEAARYHINPAAAGVMFIYRMSPLPQCVLDLNKCDVSGWFKVDALSAPVSRSSSATSPELGSRTRSERPSSAE